MSIPNHHCRYILPSTIKTTLRMSPVSPQFISAVLHPAADPPSAAPMTCHTPAPTPLSSYFVTPWLRSLSSNPTFRETREAVTMDRRIDKSRGNRPIGPSGGGLRVVYLF
ncbi:hypothetical protein FOXG_20318 [Fusarium oxysporum f. sp. lycopersici 4287]|uniref:Uncharacterized protein n=1 Tax=Fusarium oxysporum f. sp. lycopersici (strain 4287 / CBS 123668 / FGSC 9935 / NRRL 34936) TaxID=426428 RepID=A0A0J9VH53_FUSO4|nr:hypothetical protein FOXG_20318 [Fusarium oxysporum f. sp. lycopersici 4287]KNB10215.1 hypothetical protein FOXG_20318 [Fusarium oxysporum f. sp. lycopersici 4287]